MKASHTRLLTIMPDAAQVFGVVLAGGLSSRMGTNKALLEFNGKTLLRHMADVLIATGVSRVVVSGTNFQGFECIADDQTQLGPIGAFATLVKQLQNQTLLIVPVDMPLLAPVTLARLQFASGQDCAHFSDYNLPLLLQCNANVREQLQKIIHAPKSQRSLHALFAELKTHTIDLSESEKTQMRNANTPDEFKALLA